MSTPNSKSSTVDQSTSSNQEVSTKIELTDEAKRQFSFHGDVAHSFESYRQSIVNRPYFTDENRKSFFNTLNELETNCRSVLNYVAEHKKILDQPLPSIGPLIVCGLPRTGTTLLYNLLACDPNCRAPLFTDMAIDVVPPISRSDSVGQQKRLDKLQLGYQEMQKCADIWNGITSAHPLLPIEEDYEIVRQSGCFPLLHVVTDYNESDDEKWLHNEMNKHYVYKYHEIFIRMLNSVDMPLSHWLLKSPIHSMFFDKILQHYPNVCFIINHRQIDDVVASFSSLSWRLFQWISNKSGDEQRNKIIERSLQYIDVAIQSITKFRTKEDGTLDKSRKNVLDVVYDDLIHDPLGVVHRIYDHFGLNWSSEFETAMRKWLQENPNGKQGYHSYSLSEFGLDKNDIERRYADYIKLFLPSTSSATKHK